MAVVVRLAHLPEAVAHRQQGAVHARGELQRAGEEGLAAGRHDMGLDDAGARACLHQGGEPHQRVAFHHAVGVEDHHVGVGRAAVMHPFGDVAGLLAGVRLTPTIEQLLARSEPVAQLGPRAMLLCSDRRVSGVAQHEEMEGIESAGCGERMP